MANNGAAAPVVEVPPEVPVEKVAEPALMVRFMEKVEDVVVAAAESDAVTTAVTAVLLEAGKTQDEAAGLITVFKSAMRASREKVLLDKGVVALTHDLLALSASMLRAQMLSSLSLPDDEKKLLERIRIATTGLRECVDKANTDDSWAPPNVFPSERLLSADSLSLAKIMKMHKKALAPSPSAQGPGTNSLATEEEPFAVLDFYASKDPTFSAALAKAKASTDPKVQALLAQEKQVFEEAKKYQPLLAALQ